MIRSWLKGGGIAAVLLVLGTAPQAVSRPLRVMSLDQCADQFVLALRPDADIRLSPRADDADAYMRNAAKGHRRIRPTLEAAVKFKPDVVVRYWGGDGPLLRRLEEAGVTVATIEDSRDFDNIRSNIRNLSVALDVADRGEAMIAEMDGTLAKAAGVGQGRRATYMTASGFTAGRDTLIDSILRAAGYRNASGGTGYQPIGLEALVMGPPLIFVRGFFEQMLMDWRGTGRHPVLRPMMARGKVLDLPASTLTCPGWFAADAALKLAEGS
ncbi:MULTISPECIES: ABC transporter substrate-binding protein [unclassified Brevundimonas]|uniref:ABC transporter substrate-binding protein n=1 Tax=unclassified Brevundimonas TaxID=2622653 RepID=UPI0025C738F0|nr:MULTISPECIES: ABC transporter substrate-binding protein [unclassified Brevundimonas]